MEWWQILIICLLAIVFGVSVPIGIDYFLRKRRRSRVSISMKKPTEREASVKMKEKKNEIVTRAPLFSRRSIVAIAAGLLLGACAGLGYWILSPSPEATDSLESEVGSSGFFDFLVGTENVTWVCGIDIQVVSGSSSSGSVRELLYDAERYVADLNSRVFHQYVSEKLAEETPEYNHTAKELDQMITLRLDSQTTPPLISMRVTADSVEEVLFLTTFIPDVYQDFMVKLEDMAVQEEYDKTLNELEVVRASLVEAQEEEAYLALQQFPDELVNNPKYVSLNAITNALAVQLDSQASELAALIAQGNYDENYSSNLTAVERISEDLARRRKELAELTAKFQIEDAERDVEYQYVKGKVDNLNAELSRLTDRLGSLLGGSIEVMEPVASSLAVGSPTMPSPMITKGMRSRDALLMGGLIGMCAGWVTLNFKWLIKGMPSAPQPVKKEEEDE